MIKIADLLTDFAHGVNTDAPAPSFTIRDVRGSSYSETIQEGETVLLIKRNGNKMTVDKTNDFAGLLEHLTRSAR